MAEPEIKTGTVVSSWTRSWADCRTRSWLAAHVQKTTERTETAVSTEKVGLDGRRAIGFLSYADGLEEEEGGEDVCAYRESSKMMLFSLYGAY